MNSNEKSLLVVLGLVALLAAFIVLPVLEYVLLSIILAYVLYPLHSRLRTFVNPFLSAIVLIGAAILAIIVPLIYVLSVFVRDLQRLADGDTALQVATIEARLLEFTGVEVTLAPSMSMFAERLVDIFFGGVTGVISTALEIFIGIALVLFLVFYLLRDGDRFVAWLESLSPLSAADTRHLFAKVNQTMWGSVIGHSFAAIVQALVAGLGLWIVGIPSVVFWTVVMAILAFLPLIGAFLVWAPAAVYLLLIERTIAGTFLLVYGLTIVSMIDYYARPLVIDQSARLNPGVILVGVFGGLYTFGFVGLFVGPIIIGMLAATLETIKEKQMGLSAADTTTSDTSPAPPITSETPPENTSSENTGSDSVQ